MDHSSVATKIRTRFIASFFMVADKILFFFFKGRFLEFQRYHNFANLFSKLLKSTFYKKNNKQVSVKSIELKVLD